MSLSKYTNNIFEIIFAGQPLSFHYAKQQPSFPLIYRVVEERSWQISKNMITLSTVTNLKMIPFAQFIYAYIQNMVSFSTVISYFQIVSLKSVLLLQQKSIV